MIKVVRHIVMPGNHHVIFLELRILTDLILNKHGEALIIKLFKKKLINCCTMLCIIANSLFCCNLFSLKVKWKFQVETNLTCVHNTGKHWQGWPLEWPPVHCGWPLNLKIVTWPSEWRERVWVYRFSTKWLFISTLVLLLATQVNGELFTLLGGKKL